MTNLSPVEQKFVLHWGEMGTRWGINRTVAQVMMGKVRKLLGLGGRILGRLMRQPKDHHEN